MSAVMILFLSWCKNGSEIISNSYNVHLGKYRLSHIAEILISDVDISPNSYD